MTATKLMSVLLLLLSAGCLPAAGPPRAAPSPAPAGAAATGGSAAGGRAGAGGGADAARLPDSRIGADAPGSDRHEVERDASTVPDVAADVRAPLGGDGRAAPAGQGPAAQGTIVYSQDFETDLDGMTLSPPSLPAGRVSRVDDPLGQRGKVLRLIWQSGDNSRTSPNNKPRTNISNRGYEFPYGSKVSYAWGYMITSVDINATFAQHIRPGGPMWMLEGHNEGDLIVRCGGTTALRHRLVPNRWYDFRVEVDYRSNGYVQVYLDGEKVYERRDNLGFEGAKTGAAHWDGGIYNTELGISNNRTRTVYISNLSIGRN
jgi:hypothetical protein